MGCADRDNRPGGPPSTLAIGSAGRHGRGRAGHGRPRRGGPDDGPRGEAIRGQSEAPAACTAVSAGHGRRMAARALGGPARPARSGLDLRLKPTRLSGGLGLLPGGLHRPGRHGPARCPARATRGARSVAGADGGVAMRPRSACRAAMRAPFATRTMGAGAAAAA
jgi:hypothetical protein